MNPLQAVRKYGTRDVNRRLGMYFTMSPTPNNTGLRLHTEQDALSVRHISGDVIAEWPFSIARTTVREEDAAADFSERVESDARRRGVFQLHERACRNMW